MKNEWENRNVFITGGTGLVGSWLIKALVRRKSKVIVLVRDINYQTQFYRDCDYLKTDIINGSLENYNLMKRIINEYEVKTVFHLGAQTIVGAAYRDPLQTFESNIRGTYHILEACRAHQDFVKQIIIASSDKAYGIADRLPYTEDMKLAGCHPYDVSKSCTDLLAKTYYHTYKLPIAIARCGNIYGGGDLNWSRIIPGTILSLLKNERPVVRSNGKYIRDYIYVKDIVEAYISLAESITSINISGEAFNFSTESRNNVIEIVNKIGELMQKKELEPQILNMQLKEIPEQSLSSKKAHELLGWHSEYDLDTGLKETINWYKKYLNLR